MNLVIRNARIRGRDQLVDIAIDKGLIATVAPKVASKGQEEIDAAGSLVLPGLINLHLHADKSLLGEVMRPNLSGTLPEAIEITNEFKRNYDPEEVAARATRVLEAGVKNGTTFFRLFADVGTIGGLRAAQGLLLALAGNVGSDGCDQPLVDTDVEQAVVAADAGVADDEVH